jgi:hypothetical protein
MDCSGIKRIFQHHLNPAHELVNILIDEQTLIPYFIKIASLTGKILFQDKIEPDVRQFQVPINFMRESIPFR